MPIASISETKAKLSALLDRVRAGETVTITDRGVPVAQIVPLPERGDVDWDARLERLERAGLIRRGRGMSEETKKLILSPPPDVGGGVVELLLEERREGR